MFTNVVRLIEKWVNYRGFIKSPAVGVLLIAVFFLGCANAQNKKTESPQFKVRALWVDPSAFVDRETIDGLIEKCGKAGLNTIIPDIMLRGDVWFKSANFVGKVNADDRFDPLGYLIEKAHAAGMKVQPWSCVYYSEPKHPDWVSKPFISENYEHVFMSAAHPDVHPYLLSVLEELLNYDIDGIHLDYTRYWNAAFDYSDAACARFKASHGFDPKDFVDHPERIVPSDKDTYPVRVLCPNKMAEWEMGSVERNLNFAGVGYSYITESPANIDALKAPGLLIVNFYHNVPVDMMNALDRFAKRGGDIMWIDPTSTLFEDRKFNSLTGIAGARYFGMERIKLRALDDNPFGKPFDAIQAKIDGNLLTVGEAKPVVCLDTNEPVIAIHQNGKGRVMTMALGAMDNESQPIIELLRNVITSFRTQAGITGPDLMAEKRKQWIDWRASHILDFVRELNKIIKKKDPNILLTAAAGVGPQQYYGIYRDAGDWLVENIADYIFPMNYMEDVDDLQDMLDEQVSYTPDGMSDRIYPGLQLFSNKGGPIDVNTVDKQLELVKQYGYQGFCLFAYCHFSDDMVEVVNKYSK